jgi:hypothetical protein
MSKMKKLFWALPMVALFATFSCNEDGEVFVADDIVGLWTIQEASADISVGSMSLVDYLKEYLELSEIEAQAFELAMKQGIAEGMNGTVDMKSDNTYLAEFADDPPETGDWELIDGKKLKLLETGAAEPAELTIISLTSSKLVLEFEESEVEDMNQDGTDEELTMLINLTLTK